jgi:hypothetical protein
MSLSSMKRRVVALETKIGRSLATLPLTSTEIEGIVQRVATGEPLLIEELARMEAHGDIVGCNMIIGVHRGSVTVKRHLGVDMDTV